MKPLARDEIKVEQEHQRRDGDDDHLRQRTQHKTNQCAAEIPGSRGPLFFRPGPGRNPSAEKQLQHQKVKQSSHQYKHETHIHYKGLVELVVWIINFYHCGT